MPTSTARTRSATGLRRSGGAAALVLLAAALGGCALLSNEYSRQQIDVEEFADDRWTEWEPLSGLEVVSDEVCAGLVGCLQAVASEDLVVLKFDSASSAGDYVDGAGGSVHQIDPLVVDFRGTGLSTADQDAVLSTLSNINADSPD
ncbi:hypothetical protein C1I63_00560 [Rathayibacter caricis DSM 15933]|uniref:Uncharacterized protein n=1 Tax=Rathayibacter caricis DSM 15933 TaxID=1328867 RepID=A0A2T4UPP2_9MICO|nr:hypothetical protein [Rathayibacter caricis]PTL71495.1 hypothetical protein C1I63_00560 [Rathayibacter caricis DSM 15933]